MKHAIASPLAPKPVGPYSSALRAGSLLFVSGQVPTVGGEVVAGGIVAQTEQVIANLRAVLETAGCTLADVVQVTCWLDDPRDFSSFNAVFERHFIDAPPARSTVRSAIMVDAKVEIDAVAWKPLG